MGQNDVQQGVETAATAVGGVFFEPEGSVTTETWEYVGEGKGGYQKMQNFNYVGNGNGTFDKEAQRHERGTKRVAVCLLLALLLGAVASAVLIFEPDALERGQSELSALVYTTLPPTSTSSGVGLVIPETSTATTTVLGGAVAGVPLAAAVPDVAAATVATVPGIAAATVAAVPGIAAATVPPMLAPALTPAPLLAPAPVVTPAPVATPAPETVAPTTTVPVAVAVPAARAFVCTVGNEGAHASAVVGSEWVAADVDKDGHVSRDELLALKATMSKHTLGLLMKADDDQDGSLSRGEFASVFVGQSSQASDSKFQAEQATWLPDKRAWCCENEGVGCTTTTTQTYSSTTVLTTTTTLSEGLLVFGSPATAPPGVGFVPVQPAMVAPSSVGVASAAGPTAVAAADPYNCSNALNNWANEWSTGKKAWCCAVKQMGCPEASAITSVTEAPSAPCDTLCEYDSMQASCHDRVIWSAAHSFAGQPNSCDLALKAVLTHCQVCSMCTLEESGCHEAPTTTTMKTYDCGQAGISTWRQAWSDEKKRFCCQATGMGCEGITAAEPPTEPPHVDAMSFDCGKGLEAWKEAWTSQKKEFCCSTVQKGCEAGPFDCDRAQQASWSDPEKTWCCVHHALSCPPGANLKAGTLQPYNCESGYSSWQWGWSDSKQKWCCSHEKKGCKDALAGAPSPVGGTASETPSTAQPPPAEGAGALAWPS